MKFRYVVYNSQGLESYDKDFSSKKKAISFYNEIKKQLKNDLEEIEYKQELLNLRLDKVDTSFGLDWLHIGLDGTSTERIKGE